MNKLLEQTWKTEKAAQSNLGKLLAEEPENKNYKVSKDPDTGEFFLKQVQVPRNILRTSAIEKPCLFVWETAGRMYAEGHKRSEIINYCIEQGVAYHTARTQYQLWYTSAKESGEI